jgi:ABC-type antimicrobial peptide transport system permease subunit
MVVGLIVREVLSLAGGSAGTVPRAALGTHLVRSQLFGVSIAEPRVYGAGILVICLVGAFAGFIPARRAASANPVEALRAE